MDPDAVTLRDLNAYADGVTDPAEHETACSIAATYQRWYDAYIRLITLERRGSSPTDVMNRRGAELEELRAQVAGCRREFEEWAN